MSNYQSIAALTTLLVLANPVEAKVLEENMIYNVHLVERGSISEDISAKDFSLPETKNPVQKTFDPHTDLIAYFPPRRSNTVRRTRCVDDIEYCPYPKQFPQIKSPLHDSKISLSYLPDKLRRYDVNISRGI